MKTEDLKAKGLTDEQISYVMAEYGKGLNDTKKALEDTKAELANWKKQAEDTQKILEGFDGVNVDQLKKDTEEYKKQLKETEARYKQELADRDFNDALSVAIRSAKGLNEKAIKALLDTEALKSSKNQNEDIAKAIETLKTADDSKMLFTADQKDAPAKFTEPMSKTENAKTLSKADIMAISDRTERRKAMLENRELFPQLQKEV